MDTVLGMSMAPSTVRMVLMQGEDGEGATVDEDAFDIGGDGESGSPSAPDRVIEAILGTREGANEGGYQLRSTGVTWNDQAEAIALRDALAARKIENVMLVSAFMAAAALAQEVGASIGYGHTGLLFVEPDAATVAVVGSDDGSVTQVRRESLTGDTVTRLAALVADLQRLEPHPDGLFMVGSGVDITALKPQLEATTSLPVSAPDEPDTALARGAALASANAPVFESSTMALAYAQDPDTGFIDPLALTPGYRPETSDDADAYAYSADEFDESDAPTGLRAGSFADVDDRGDSDREHRSLTLVVSAVAAVFVVGVVALAVALLMTMHPKVGEQPNPGQQVVPSKQAPPQTAPPPAPAAPAPAPAASAPAPAPEAPAPAPAASAPASAPEAPAPAPVAPAPAPVAPAPAPVAPAPAPVAPAPAPVAPAPAPVAPAPAPVAPAPPRLPIPIPVPRGGLPGGGGHIGSGGPGFGRIGGGVPGIPGIPGI